MRLRRAPTRATTTPMSTERPPRAPDTTVPTVDDDYAPSLPVEIVYSQDEAGIPSIGLAGGEIEQRYSIPDPYLRLLFMALCKQRGLMAYRRARQREETICVRTTIERERELWSRYTALCDVMAERLVEVSREFIGAHVPGALASR
jgi:hypothetical protein